VKRSALGPGQKALDRGSTFQAQGSGRSRLKRKPISPASPVQRAKVKAQVCAVCQAEHVDAAHLTPRGFRGCDSEDCVIGLCRAHHRAFDDGALDLLPFLSGGGFEAELAHMQGHYSDPLSVVFRLSGCRWIPESEAA
jgi:hypothetical protein